MLTIAQTKPRLAVLYDGAADTTIYEIAVEIASRAWDAGVSVRVRRLGDPCGAGIDPQEVPLARPEDVEWASVTLMLSRPDLLAGTPRHRSTPAIPSVT
jgi:hypothetical protein